ncbi:MAG: hypothetical protein ABR611_05850 [Chthoniobacterales bacterium]
MPFPKCEARAEQALASLFQTYWNSLYAQVRRRGYGEHAAENFLSHETERARAQKRGGGRELIRNGYNNPTGNALMEVYDLQWFRVGTDSPRRRKDD